MKEPENCHIKYCGYSSPQSEEEVAFEILGLKNLIAKAEQRISFLKQTSYIAKLAITNNFNTLDEYFGEKENEDSNSEECKE